jgi:hypothetical protein
VLLRNVNDDHNHWVGLQLIGSGKSPRDAIGATAFLSAGKLRQRADVTSGGSYESSSDMRLHFGLGDETAVRDLEIHWPDGKVEHVVVPGVDRYFTVAEGQGVVPGIYDHVKPAAKR